MYLSSNQKNNHLQYSSGTEILSNLEIHNFLHAHLNVKRKGYVCTWPKDYKTFSCAQLKTQLKVSTLKICRNRIRTNAKKTTYY